MVLVHFQRESVPDGSGHVLFTSAVNLRNSTLLSIFIQRGFRAGSLVFSHTGNEDI